MPQVKKDTQQLREFEEGLVSQFKFYLEDLEQVVKGEFVNPSPCPSVIGSRRTPLSDPPLPFRLEAEESEGQSCRVSGQL